MKKSFVLFIMLLVLGVAVVSFGKTSILAEKDNVKITENVLYGDKSMVEGVTLELHNHYENQIFWDTTYVLGEEPKVETEYTFYQTRQNDYDHRWYGNIYFNDDMHSIGWDEDTMKAPQGLEVAVQELKDSIGPSESGTKTVFLKDYIDYYSFSVSFRTPYDDESNEKRFHYELDARRLRYELPLAEESVGKNYGYSEGAVEQFRKELKWIETFHEFFKIPVLENEVYMISMKKDENENVIGWGMSSKNGGMGSGESDVPEFTDTEDYDDFSLNTYYFVGDGDVYLTFHTHSYNQAVVDTSLIPGGYGIYHFPYDLEKEEIYPEQLQMVYALDPNLDVVDLTRDARGENLLLFTIEDTELYMSIIDIETMTLVNKFNISESREDVWGIDYYVTEEEYMVVLTYRDVIVFSIDENGTYTKEFEASREPLNAFMPKEDENYNEFLQYNTVYDWNGEELIFANNMYNVNGYDGTNFYVGMMDTNGLQYFAIYETSLQSEVSKDENGYDAYTYAHVRPVDYDPIVVNWE
ncbi:MAG: hypothetical protein IJO60_06895 [Agathobacter sp.]|nr:hypothetical protein [Agathobacter sp.]